MTPKPTGGCTPTPETEDELTSKIAAALNCTINDDSRIGPIGSIVDKADDKQPVVLYPADLGVLVGLIRTEVLKARMDESKHWQSRIIDITKGFVSADFAKESGYDHLKKLSDQLQANQKEERKNE